ncbi:hypothetical protein SDC9_148822 [bioreactor metagenome]|uniref:Uncharacterized protein n=1 Tax=bioreactor metagenome TaxID=1076179 RepID=A0A645EK04_9ZZZZ
MNARALGRRAAVNADDQSPRIVRRLNADADADIVPRVAGEELLIFLFREILGVRVVQLADHAAHRRIQQLVAVQLFFIIEIILGVDGLV